MVLPQDEESHAANYEERMSVPGDSKTVALMGGPLTMDTTYMEVGDDDAMDTVEKDARVKAFRYGPEHYPITEYEEAEYKSVGSSG